MGVKLISDVFSFYINHIESKKVGEFIYNPLNNFTFNKAMVSKYSIRLNESITTINYNLRDLKLTCLIGDPLFYVNQYMTPTILLFRFNGSDLVITYDKENDVFFLIRSAESIQNKVKIKADEHIIKRGINKTTFVNGELKHIINMSNRVIQSDLLSDTKVRSIIDEDIINKFKCGEITIGLNSFELVGESEISKPLTNILKQVNLKKYQSIIIYFICFIISTIILNQSIFLMILSIFITLLLMLREPSIWYLIPKIFGFATKITIQGHPAIIVNNDCSIFAWVDLGDKVKKYEVHQLTDINNENRVAIIYNLMCLENNTKTKINKSKDLKDNYWF